MPDFLIRAATASDGGFLADMVVEAVNWRSSGGRPRHEVLVSDEHGRYVAGWRRPGDAGFVATDANGDPIGAAWYRTMPQHEPGFGYVGTGVPELIIGVRPIWRAHGVGRALLQALGDQARSAGYGRLSLSVQHGNHAETLYRSEGFIVVEVGELRDIMVKRLG